MAASNASYPKMPAKAWSVLRARAAAAPSVKLNPANVAALLGMASPDSARDNVVTHLRRMGLVDDDGALTQRGHKWRIDSSYGDACQEILDAVYPDDLNILTDSTGKPDPQKVKTWFDHQGFGDSNARQMANTYAMIANKALPDPATDNPKAPVQKPVKAPATKKSAAVPTNDGQAHDTLTHSVAPQPAASPSHGGPNLHLDIQIHIPADAGPEQIDQIFASMAKHLYGR